MQAFFQPGKNDTKLEGVTISQAGQNDIRTHTESKDDTSKTTMSGVQTQATAANIAMNGNSNGSQFSSFFGGMLQMSSASMTGVSFYQAKEGQKVNLTISSSSKGHSTTSSGSAMVFSAAKMDVSAPATQTSPKPG